MCSPGCRLDLDPLHTLHGPSDGHDHPLHPGPTGSARPGVSHPYTRGPEDGPHAPATEGPAPSLDQHGQPELNQTQTGQNPVGQPQPGHPPFTFIWHMPVPHPPVPPEQPASSSQPMQTESITQPVDARPTSEDVVRPATPNGMPNLVFNIPIHSSPLPMNRPASPVPVPSVDEAGSSTDQTSPNQGSQPPHPERRPHITFVHGPMGVPHSNSPHHHHHHHVVHHHSPPPQIVGGHAPNIQVFLNIPRPDEQPRHRETASPSPVPREGPADSPGPTAAPATAAAAKSYPFVPQSLESWAEQREKALGWRCDGPECSIAPSTDPEGDIDMLDEDVCPEGKEMLSIFSPSQSAFNRQESNATRDFVILACEHRWHRACLETAERSSKRGVLRANPDGRIWVRCQRCRKDGWVNDVEGTPSEGEQAEVERIVTA